MAVCEFTSWNSGAGIDQQGNTCLDFVQIKWREKGSGCSMMNGKSGEKFRGEGGRLQLTHAVVTKMLAGLRLVLQVECWKPKAQALPIKPRCTLQMHLRAHTLLKAHTLWLVLQVLNEVLKAQVLPIKPRRTLQMHATHSWWIRFCTLTLTLQPEVLQHTEGICAVCTCTYSDLCSVYKSEWVGKNTAIFSHLNTIACLHAKPPNLLILIALWQMQKHDWQGSGAKV